ncbi:head-tail connector protein [Veillonella ratti]|uniref:head-tail connector protein n=1 Tax=Veillonella ratti TaxID=103892 RepID=UPI000F8F61A8|nr:head-tail connector protein [Veillonella ratti]
MAVVELEKIKNFLRIDEDLTEDDDLIMSLTEAAQTIIEQMTGRTYDNSQLFTLAIMQLVGHWYENRSIYTTKTNIHDMPLSVQAIINHLGVNAGQAKGDVND